MNSLKSIEITYFLLRILNFFSIIIFIFSSCSNLNGKKITHITSNVGISPKETNNLKTVKNNKNKINIGNSTMNKTISCMLSLIIFSILSNLMLRDFNILNIAYNLDYGTINPFISKKETIFDDAIFPLERINPNKIIYIKSFKTGSTTMQNLIHSLCFLYNRSCPIVGNPLVSFEDNSKKLKFIKQTKSLKCKKTPCKFDTWSSHLYPYDPAIFDLIPNSSYQFFSIFRDPFSRLVSGLKFKKYQHKDKNFMNITAELLIDKSYEQFKLLNFSYEKFYGKREQIFKGILNLNDKKAKHATGVIDRLMFNSYCNQFFPNWYINYDFNQTIFDKYNNLEKIRNGDFLVLITERWDESLFILKKAYNLTSGSFIYLKQKVQFYNKSKNFYTDELRYKERLINHCDWQIYNLTFKILDNIMDSLYTKHSLETKIQIEEIKELTEKRVMECQNKTFKIQKVCKSITFGDGTWDKWASNFVKKNK